MMSEHRASSLAGVAAPCGGKTEASPAGRDGQRDFSGRPSERESWGGESRPGPLGMKVFG